ncbi:MAG: hypothetical protein L6461_12370 [Anaerolineae bacterium]|nr:hypothetical protein [Anaerolineae bacterium]
MTNWLRVFPAARQSPTCADGSSFAHRVEAPGPATLILLLVEFIETCPENVPGAGITSKDTHPPRPRQVTLTGWAAKEG